MSKNDDVVPAGYPFFGENVPAHQKRISSHAHKSWSLRTSVDLFRLIGSREVEVCAAPRIDVLKSFVLPLPIQIIASRNYVVTTLNLRPHHHQLVGIGIR